MNKLFYILLLQLIFSYQPIKRDTNFNNLLHNTIINIYLKNDSDKQYCTLMKYDKFALTNSLLEDFLIESDYKKTNILSYKFYLSSPCILLFNTLPIYIEPGSTTDLSFEQFGKDKNLALIQKIELLKNKTNSILLSKNSNTDNEEVVQLRTKMLSEIVSKKNKSELVLFDSLANIKLIKILNQNKDFVLTENRRTFLTQTFIESYYINFLIAYVNKINTLSEAPKESITSLNSKMSYSDTVKQFQYFYSQKKLYDSYYKPKWDLQKNSINFIIKDLQVYDTITQQYYYTLLLLDKTNHFTNEEFSNLKSRITNKNLITWVINDAAQNTMNNLKHAVNGITLYNFNKSLVDFESLIENTKQEYLYFDFMGSWCVPCMKEIAEWNQSNQWIRNSKIVKPFWIFFENNTTDWLNVVNKYNLPKENCFVITNTNLQKIFSKYFDWAGEFPHHYIFKQNGTLINAAAPASTKINEQYFIN